MQSSTDEVNDPEVEKDSALIYSYGCRPPSVGADLFARQLELSHGYGNALVRIERDKREREEALKRTHCEDIDRLTGEREALTALINASVDELRERRRKAAAERVAEGKRVSRDEHADLSKTIREAKARRTAAGAELKEARAAFWAPLKVADAEYDRRVLALCEANGKSGPTSKAEYNAAVLAVMLLEPQWPQAWKEIESARATALTASKAARAEWGRMGLHTENYKLVEEAVTNAVQKTAKLGESPRFRRRPEDGRYEGRVGCQLRDGGSSAADVMAGLSTVVRIRDLVPHSCKGGAKRQRMRGIVDIRVNSDAKGRPVWASLPFVMHRPIPEAAVIKYAWITARNECGRMRYNLQLTLRVPRSSDDRQRGTHGSVALHLAYRKSGTEDAGNENIRAGYVVGTDGFAEPVYLPAHNEKRGVLAQHRFAAELRSGGDIHFNEARDVLRAWINAERPVPKWMAFEAKFIAHWRGHDKLEAVARWWSQGYPGRTVTNRETGEVVTVAPASGLFSAQRVAELWRTWRDHCLGKKPDSVPWSKWHAPKRDLFAPFDQLDAWLQTQGVSEPEHRMALYLEWWSRKERHMKAMEHGNRESALRWRKDSYRVLWSQLSKRYGTLVICNTRMDVQQRRAPAEEKEKIHDKARAQRTVAAPGELRSLGVERFGKSRVAPSVDLGEIRAAATCSLCGDAFAADDSAEVGRCGNGHEVDRDENAARNMLVAAGFFERPGGALDTALAREAAE